ncbi:hypothetical protein BBU64B_J0043 (plasmid) [Borreliella burgdorferi 64b]|nr:hypothetical protein BBU64B_J0043 [Borreliella burgdorferi 64b]
MGKSNKDCFTVLFNYSKFISKIRLSKLILSFYSYFSAKSI